MKRFCRMAALALALVLLLAALPAQAATKDTLTVTFQVTAYQNRAREALSKINAARKKAGLGELKMLADLEKVALQRAAELFVHFDHKRPDMTDYDTADDDYAAVRRPLVVGESISAGYSSAKEVCDKWLSEDDAQDNFLAEDFTHVGIACVNVKGSYNGTYWVAYFQGYDSVKATAASSKASAGVKKNMTVQIKRTMFNKADSSHKSFALQCDDLNMKNRASAKLTVYLVDGRGVTIGKCENSDLTIESNAKAVCTVLKNGTVTRKKTGTATLTIKGPGLSAIKVGVTCGAASTTSKEIKTPTLSVRDSKAAVTFTCSQKGAQGFALYRATTKNGAYRRVDEQETDDSYSYRVEKADKTKTYWYKIKTWRKSGGDIVYSAASAPVKVSH